MKKVLCLLFFSMFLFSSGFCEEIDVDAMPAAELITYCDSLATDQFCAMLESLSMRDVLVLMNKIGYPVDVFFSSMFSETYKGLSDIPDMDALVAYLALGALLEQRDLTKYIPAVSDYSGVAIASTPAPTQAPGQEVSVPVGTYEIGKDIPAGEWHIVCSPNNYCYVTIGYALEENKMDIPYGCKGYYHIAMVGTDSGISDRGYPYYVDLDLADGMYIQIEHAGVTFTRYTGSNLSFSFD